MYVNFFGLRSHPFEDRADTQFFYPTPDAEEVVAAMEYEAHYGKGMALVLGEAGTGKTLLIRALLLRLEPVDHPVVLTWPAGGGLDLIRETCKGFGVTLPATYNAARGIARLRSHVERNHRAGNRAILIVDQVEHFDDSCLSQITELSDLSNEGDGLLRIILIGQPQFTAALEAPAYQRLKQRFFGERRLRPLNATETERYIQHRLRMAGAVDAAIFEEGTAAVIHRSTSGIPRLINHVCDQALLAAYGSGVKTVTTRIVADVTGDTMLCEKSADVRDVWMRSVSEVADGLPGGGEKRMPTWSPRDPVAVPPGTPAPPIAPPSEGDHGAAEHDPVPYVAEPEVWEASDDESIDLASGSGVTQATQTLYANVDARIARIERVIARAERASATSETRLTQALATEKHLATLTDNAERLAEHLAGTMQRATETLEQVQARMDHVVREAESHAEQVESLATRAGSRCTDIDEQVQRVEQACDRAEQMETRLGTYTEQLADRADKVQDQMTVLMTGLDAGEKAQAKLEQTLTRVQSATGQAEEAIETRCGRLKEAVRESENLEQNLTDAMLRKYQQQLSETFERHAQEHQRRIESADEALQRTEARLRDILAESAVNQEKLCSESLRTYRDRLADELEMHERSQHAAVKAAQAELESLRKKATSSVAEARETMEMSMADHRARLRETMDEFAEQTKCVDQRIDAHQKTVDGQLADCQRSSSTLIEQLHGEIGTLRSQAECCVSEMRAAMEDAQAGHRQALQHAVEAFTEEVQHVDARIEQHRARTDELLMHGEQASSGALAEMNEEAGKLRVQVEASVGEARTEMAEVQAAHRSKLQHMMDEFAAKAQEVDVHLAQRRSAADALVADCEQSSSGLIEKMNEGVAALQAKAEAIESRQAAVQESFDGLCAGLDGAAETVTVMTESVDALQATAAEEAKRANGIRDGLSELVEHGEKLISDVRVGCGQIEAVQRTVATTLMDIGQACEQASVAHGKIAACDDLAAQLASAHQEGEKLARALDARLASGQSLCESMQRVEADAAEQVGKLGSHSAAAGNVTRQLSEATVSAHEVLKDVTESAAAAAKERAQTRSELEPFLEELRSLATTSQTTASELCSANSRAEALMQQLTRDIQPAADVVMELTERLDEARSLAGSIAERSAEASNLAERLASATHTLDAAKETEESITTAVKQAQTVQTQLSGLTTDAAQQYSRLQECGASLQGFIDAHEQVKAETESATERLSDHVETANSTFEAGERLLREFVGQSQSLSTRLRDMTRKTEQFEQEVARMTEGPQEILVNAQTQAAQLERVCGAVRKVFAGLSRAALEAREHTQACEGTTQKAAEKVSQLKQETDRAARTLHEWVQEAVRAQARLESTLSACPSIRETHAGDALGHTGSAEAIAAVSPPAVFDEGTGSDPLHRPFATMEPAAADASVNEVGRLIEDAKRAATRNDR